MRRGHRARRPQSVNVALYARVSKAHTHQDPEAQLQPLREMCRSRGWTIAHEYVDSGFSGAKENRPGLDELMRDCERGYRHFDAICVWKFDRFARSTKHLLRALETFDQLGIAFVSLSESIDTSTSYGKLVFTILGAVAELERSLIAERIKNGMKKAGARKPGPKVSSRGPSKSTLWRRSRHGIN
jgi:DNA invertase Pin-like site-specific DNA recombinase